MATATDTRGNVVKMDVDFSSNVTELLPKCEALVKVKQIPDSSSCKLSSVCYKYVLIVGSEGL